MHELLTLSLLGLLLLCRIQPVEPQAVGFLSQIDCPECLVIDAGGLDYVNTTKNKETNRWGTPCSGTTVIRGSMTSGPLSDGCSPRYTPNMYCRWVIEPDNAHYVYLNIHQLNLENAWDFVNVTDGAGVFLGSFTGNESTSTPIVSTSGKLEVTFYSDEYSHKYGWNSTGDVVTGFNATWSVESSGCPNACSGHGVCKEVCECSFEWFGADCSQSYCSGTKIETSPTGFLMDWQRTPDDWNTPTENQILDQDIYKNHMDCRWLIKPARMDTSIRFRVWISDLERTRDTLSIYEGNSTDAPLLSLIDLNAERSLRPVAPIIQSSVGMAYVHYRTDYLTKRGGIFLSWSVLETCQDTCMNGKCSGDTCVCDSGWWGGDCSQPYCMGTQVRTARVGEVLSHSKAGRYNDLSDCIWEIQPAVPVNFLMIYVTFFATEAGSDFLSLHDGSTIQHPKVLKDYSFTPTYDSHLTGDGIDRTMLHNQVALEGVESYIYSKHQVMLTSGSALYMRFQTDINTHNITLSRRLGGSRYPGLLDQTKYGPGEQLGFRMEYKGVFCGGLNRHYGQTGTLTDGSGVYQYYGGQYCLFWIRANASYLTHSNQKLELTFHNTSIHKSDMLRVLDGNVTTANVLQAYHNTYGSEFSVTTTSNLTDGVLIEFGTDEDDHGGGFNVSWKLVDVDPDQTCTRNRTLRLTAPFGTFSDHQGNFSTYPNSIDCHWEIQLEPHVQQIELFVEKLALHPGKSWDYFRSSGLGQQGLLRVGQSHHPFADWVALYNTHEAASGWDSAHLVGNYTGYFNTPVYNTENVTNVPQPISMTFNGTTAGCWFHTTPVYNDRGFEIRYQAVYSDANNVEMWGRGLEFAAVGKAASFTLRTKRKLYAGLKDVRNGIVHNNSSAAAAPIWYMTQGGAQLRVRLWTGSNDATGNEIFIPGEVLDLQTGYYLLSYNTQLIGRYKVTVEMLSQPETGYAAPSYRQVNGSPFYVDVKLGPVHVTGSSVSGEGLTSASPGTLREFTIRAGDEQGNYIPHGGHRFVAKVDGPSSVACVIKDQGDGTYKGSYTVTKAGAYNLHISLSYGEELGPTAEVGISGSPFQLVVSPLPCPGSCSGNGVCRDDGVCDCTAAFEGDDCSSNTLQFYQDFLLYENVILGVIVYIYCVYSGYLSFKESRKGMRGNSVGDDDDSDEEEEEFTGLYCCMHW